MPARKPAAKNYIHSHRDGSLWAVGQTIDGVATGYWEWFRKDGSKLRSGWFEEGEQVGEWTTYDKNGGIFKVTVIKPRGK
jgi:antitoxin component YwqK of YwqJK toxin-antitoxin module